MEGGSTPPSSGRSGSCRIRRTVSPANPVPLKQSFHFQSRSDVLHGYFTVSYHTATDEETSHIQCLTTYQDCNCASDRMTPSHQDISPPDTPEHHWVDPSIQICPTCCSHVLNPDLFFTRVKMFYFKSTFLSNVIISKYFVSDITQSGPFSSCVVI